MPVCDHFPECRVSAHIGRPVAMLVPPELCERADAAAAGRAMLAYRDRVKRRLGNTFRELVHEGPGTDLGVGPAIA